ncbi:transposase [Candidatus Falkowbacteria bacterium]|nr:transposase [Candidatus Falkowbacteria bacterium]
MLTIKTAITVYHNLKQKVSFLYKKLNLQKIEPTKGRKFLIPIIDLLALGLFRARENIATKRSLADIFNLRQHYKTLVVNLNRFGHLVALMLLLMLRQNRDGAHVIKHTDATDIPVCLVKNGAKHKTMAALAAWGKTGKGWFYGLKLHLTSDLGRKVLAVTFTRGNQPDSTVFLKLNQDLTGIFLADAAYTGEALAREFHEENRRWLLAGPRKNMRKLMSRLEATLYATRMMVEWNFRCLKMTYGIQTSLPRSINGYLAHYVYALTAFVLG